MPQHFFFNNCVNLSKLAEILKQVLFFTRKNTKKFISIKCHFGSLNSLGCGFCGSYSFKSLSQYRKYEVINRVEFKSLFYVLFFFCSYCADNERRDTKKNIYKYIETSWWETTVLNMCPSCFWVQFKVKQNKNQIEINSQKLEIENKCWNSITDHQ